MKEIIRSEQVDSVGEVIEKTLKHKVSREHIINQININFKIMILKVLQFK